MISHSNFYICGQNPILLHLRFSEWGMERKNKEMNLMQVYAKYMFVF